MRLTLAIDYEGDWAALYDGNNRVTQGHISDVRQTALERSNVHLCNVDGVLDGDVGEEFPPHLLTLRNWIGERHR